MCPDYLPKFYVMNKLKKYEIKSCSDFKNDFNSEKISCSGDSARIIKQFYKGDIDVFESFFILLLNRANKTIGYAKISQGGITGTVVDVKIVAKFCVDTLASGVVMAHNHPSGCLRPSEADKSITKKIKKALDLLDVVVLDHIILTEDSYYSFCDEGTL